MNKAAGFLWRFEVLRTLAKALRWLAFGAYLLGVTGVAAMLYFDTDYEGRLFIVGLIAVFTAVPLSISSVQFYRIAQSWRQNRKLSDEAERCANTSQ